MGDFVSKYIRSCRDHPVYYWIGIAVFSILAFYGAANIEIDSNLKRLLPPDAPSVVGLNQLEKAYDGRLGRLTVVVQRDKNTANLHRVAEKIGPRLQSVQGVKRVEWKKPLRFFEKQRLLYLEYPDLQTVEKRIKKRLKWEKARANPLFVDVGDDSPPSLDFTDIESSYDRLNQSEYYTSEDGDTLLVFIYPSFPANKLAKSRQLLRRVEPILDEHITNQKSDISYGLTGRYMRRVDFQNILESDLTRATTVAFILIFLFLMLFVRSWVGTAITLIPLMVGTGWALAWTNLAFGSLNILTSFLGAVLLGLGVDYGIHLYLRLRELHHHYPPAEALARAFRTTGKANLFAGLTTIVALGSLTISEFQAFFEFGVVAVGGLFLILVSYAVVFPALVWLAERYDAIDGKPLSVGWTTFGTDKLSTSIGNRSTSWRALLRYSLIGIAILGFIGLAGIPKVQFGKNFGILRATSSSSWHLDKVADQIMGRPNSPAVVLTSSPAQSQKVAEEIRAKAKNTQFADALQKVVYLGELLPDKQTEKLEIIEGLIEQIKDLPVDARPDKVKDFLEEMKRLVRTAPLSAADLPPSVRAPFERKDAQNGSVVLVFPSSQLSTLSKIEQFIGPLRDLSSIDRQKAYDVINDGTLLYDIVRYVERDLIWMLLLTLLGLFGMSWLAFRNWFMLGLQMGLVGFAVFVSVGVLGLVPVDFNFLNVVVIPIWLGLGVDASFHILTHIREAPDDLRSHFSTAFAVAAAFVTSIIGFGALLLAHHAGLNSLGGIAVWGLGTILVVNIVAQIGLVSWACLPNSPFETDD